MTIPAGSSPVVARLAFRETFRPGLFLLFLGGGALAALLPGAQAGGRGPALWTLAALAVAAGLAAGLAGPWTPGRLFRSPWFAAQPPGPRAAVPPGAAGLGLGLLALLLPVLILPLPSWTALPGAFHEEIPLVKALFRPGPANYLLGPGSQGRFFFRPGRPVTALEILAQPVVGPDKDFRPAHLTLSIQGGPSFPLGEVGVESRTFRIPLDPPRPLGEIRITRRGGPGLFLYLPPQGIKALGRTVPPTQVWLQCGAAALGLALFTALALAWAGTVLSRPAALLAGGAWGLLALADPLFRLGFPGGAAQGVAPGWDLWGGRGWAPFGGALLFVLLLAWKPGRPRSLREAAR